MLIRAAHRASRLIAVAAVCSVVLAISPVRAEPAVAAPDFTEEDADSARFHVGRAIVEFLASSVAGGAAAYGTYAGVCGGSDCLAGALLGLGANMVVTPLVTYGVGRAMGGQGTLGYTIVGASLGLSLGSAIGNAATGTLGSPQGLVYGVALMPVMAPIGFEASSHQRSVEMKRALAGPRIKPVAAPVIRSDGIRGVVVGLVGTL